MQRDPTHRGKYGLEQTCLDLYSDPNFFLKQWLDEEEDKRKALRAERKAKKAARGAGAAGPKKAKGGAVRREFCLGGGTASAQLAALATGPPSPGSRLKGALGTS